MVRPGLSAGTCLAPDGLALFDSAYVDLLLAVPCNPVHIWLGHVNSCGSKWNDPCLWLCSELQ